MQGPKDNFSRDIEKNPTQRFMTEETEKKMKRPKNVFVFFCFDSPFYEEEEGINDKVRDRCHIAVTFWGTAHTPCNLKVKQNTHDIYQ